MQPELEQCPHLVQTSRPDLLQIELCGPHMGSREVSFLASFFSSFHLLAVTWVKGGLPMRPTQSVSLLRTGTKTVEYTQRTELCFRGWEC